jgi:hypothetical protein
MTMTTENSSAVKFETGRTYECRSACDSGCRWTFTVEKRTAGTVWFREHGPEGLGVLVRRKLDTYNGAETFFPFGKYSMAPIVRAQ